MKDFLRDYLLELVLGILTAAGAILIVANYGSISAGIAIMVANMLTSILPLFFFIGLIVALIIWWNSRAGWRRRRRW